MRRYVPGFVDVVAGQTVSVDLAFDGTGCGLSGVREATHLSWKRDGSEIGFLVVSSPFRISAAGGGPGAPWWQGAGLTTSPAWSPVNNQVLYGRDLVGIQRVEPDTEQGGTSIVPPQQGGYPDYPAWLPDGSGFLYVESGNLFYSSIQGTNIRQLTFFVNEFVHQPSVSPDGNYVVFERQSGDLKLLWLMEWDNPTNMWPLVQGRRPDWSRVDPSVPGNPTPVQTPTPGSTPTSTPLPGSTPTSTPVPLEQLPNRLYLPSVTR